jgi:hypothetical protein
MKKLSCILIIVLSVAAFYSVSCTSKSPSNVTNHSNDLSSDQITQYCEDHDLFYKYLIDNVSLGGNPGDTLMIFDDVKNMIEEVSDEFATYLGVDADTLYEVSMNIFNLYKVTIDSVDNTSTEITKWDLDLTNLSSTDKGYIQPILDMVNDQEDKQDIYDEVVILSYKTDLSLSIKLFCSLYLYEIDNNRGLATTFIADALGGAIGGGAGGFGGAVIVGAAASFLAHHWWDESTI